MMLVLSRILFGIKETPLRALAVVYQAKNPHDRAAARSCVFMSYGSERSPFGILTGPQRSRNRRLRGS